MQKIYILLYKYIIYIYYIYCSKFFRNIFIYIYYYINIIYIYIYYNKFCKILLYVYLASLSIKWFKFSVNTKKKNYIPMYKTSWWSLRWYQRNQRNQRGGSSKLDLNLNVQFTKNNRQKLSVGDVLDNSGDDSPGFLK